VSAYGAEPLEREPRHPASRSKGHPGTSLTEQGKLPSESALQRGGGLFGDTAGLFV
jgi:hypothetical protein